MKRRLTFMRRNIPFIFLVVAGLTTLILTAAVIAGTWTGTWGAGGKWTGSVTYKFVDSPGGANPHPSRSSTAAEKAAIREAISEWTDHLTDRLNVSEAGATDTPDITIRWEDASLFKDWGSDIDISTAVGMWNFGGDGGIAAAPWNQGAEAANYPTNEIYLNEGKSWFVDPTPKADTEYDMNGTHGTAKVGGDAEGKWDLLTVFKHEFGHALGLQHGAGWDVMEADWPSGVRRHETTDDVSALQTLYPEPPPSTAVYVTSFLACINSDHVEVNWITDSELNTAGFNLYRSGEPAGQKIRLNGALIPSRGNEIEGAEYSYVDDQADGARYYYWLEDVSLSGETAMNGMVLAEPGDTPVTFSLAQNYPNPFNPNTIIEYRLSKSGHVKLDIYNIAGQRIVTLKDQFEQAGRRSVSWDGKDFNGSDVVSGVYFYKLTAGDDTEIKKMILLR
ncbi:MAG: zinc-dependent metalloprotease [Bacteroidales bacterium]|nr:zinc-dependent metalloprotease [Candidatus Latescibacterota bacterium]